MAIDAEVLGDAERRMRQDAVRTPSGRRQDAVSDGGVHLVRCDVLGDAMSVILFTFQSLGIDSSQRNSSEGSEMDFCFPIVFVRSQ